MAGQQLEPSDPTGLETLSGRNREDQTKMRSCSKISVDFETAIQEAGFGKFNLMILLIAVPASCCAMLDTGSMAYVVPVAGNDLELTPTSKALLQSAPFAGMICSAWIWGILADSLGRQRLLAIGYLLDFVMNTGCALIPYLPTILIFKYLSGIMVCGPSSIFMAYISEVFLSKRRNFAVLSLGIFSSLGSILHVCVALLLIPAELPSWFFLKSWQLFILVCGIPLLLAGAACAFSVESPKFLVDKGKSEKAMNVCKTIYTINTGQAANFYPVKKIRNPDVFSKVKKRSVLKESLAATVILRPPYINRLLLLCGIQICIQVTSNMIRLWLPEMLTVIANTNSHMTNKTTLCPILAAGQEAQQFASHIISREEIYYKMIITNAICLLAHVIFIVTVNYLEKKFITMSVVVISMCCAPMIPNIHSAYVFIPASIIVAVLSIAFYSQIGLAVEIFPTSVRATSISIIMMTGWTAVLLGNFIFSNLLYSNCENIFYGLAICCFSALCISFFLVTTPFSGFSPQETKKDKS